LALAVALREALARRLGVEPDEMGISADQRRDQLGRRTVSIFLHDKATGGAGFASQAEDLFADMLRDAAAILGCKVPGCVRACPSCVLVSDLSEDEARLIDRRPALAMVRDRLLTDGAPEPEDRVTPQARFSGDLFGEVNRAVGAAGGRVTLSLGAPLDVAELGSWGAVPWLERWRARGVSVVVGLPEESQRELDGAQRLRLRDLANRWGVLLETSKPATFSNGAHLLAEVVDAGGGATAFATRDALATAGGEGWGRAAQAPVVRFPLAQPAWRGSALPIDSLREDAGAALRHVAHEFDGRLSDFGARMGSALRDLCTKVGAPKDEAIVAFEYEDRYLRSPITVRLLVDTLQAMSKGAGKTVSAVVRTIPLEPKDQIARYLDNDWKTEEHRAAVARLLAGTRGLALDWRTGSAGHGRRLCVTFSSGRRVQILLDQGFGSWRCDRGTAFEFRAAQGEQASRLRKLDTGVQIAQGTHTYFVAEAAPAA
jgi:hypothetical protein